MKQVWQCEHCTETHIHPNVIQAHEKTCYMNPAVKDCGSCKNNIRNPFEMYWQCSFGIDFEDDKTLPCKKWVAK